MKMLMLVSLTSQFIILIYLLFYHQMTLGWILSHLMLLASKELNNWAHGNVLLALFWVVFLLSFVINSSFSILVEPTFLEAWKFACTTSGFNLQTNCLCAMSKINSTSSGLSHRQI